jgi:hypothetical protein
MILSLCLLGCPIEAVNKPSKDDTSEPADGGTGANSCEDETNELRDRVVELEAELRECRSSSPK